MSLFDKAVQSPGVDTPLSPREALVGVLLAAAGADGRVGTAEAARVNHVMGTMRLFRGASPEQIGELANRVMGRLATRGPSPLLDQAASALPPELGATAFVLATDLVLTDGRASDGEKAFIDSLQAALHVDEAFALKVIEVMLVKNQA